MQKLGSTRIRLAIPWLQPALRAAREAGEELQLPALDWLVARADRVRGTPKHWREWLIEATPLPQDALRSLAAGPCLRRLYGFDDRDTPARTWACARPVHLATALDHLRLVPVEDIRLPAVDAAELAAHVNAHLAETGFAVEGHDLETWLLRGPADIECTTYDPADAVGQNIRDFMPAGQDGARVRSLMNELQMLLHEHPVNERRATRGLAPVNCLWLWGFGAAREVARQPLPRLASDDEWLDGLWRLHGESTEALGACLPPSIAESWPALVGHRYPPSARAVDALRQVDAGCLASLRDGLRSGVLEGVDVLCGEVSLSLGRAARLRFWRRAPELAEVLP